jgi:hypothetical protein
MFEKEVKESFQNLFNSLIDDQEESLDLAVKLAEYLFIKKTSNNQEEVERARKVILDLEMIFKIKIAKKQIKIRRASRDIFHQVLNMIFRLVKI